MTDPTTFEQSMSLLTFALGSIERNPPVNPDDVNRLRLAVSRIDTACTRASRALENVK